MAIEFFCAYNSYLKAMETLTDAERGRLFVSLLEYNMTGIAPELRGSERHVFPLMREQIDRDKANYAKKCEIRRESGKKGASKRWQDIANDSKNSKCHFEHSKNSQVEDKDKDKGEGEYKEQTDCQSVIARDGFATVDDVTAYQNAIGDIERTAKYIGLRFEAVDYDRAVLLMAEYTAEWLLAAMNRTARKESRTWAYVEGILKAWKREGGIDKGVKPTAEGKPALGSVNAQGQTLTKEGWRWLDSP